MNEALLAKNVVEEFLTVPEVAQILRVSNNAVREWFKDIPGVIDCGPPQKPHRRFYRTLRIPRSSLEVFIKQHEARYRKYEAKRSRGRRCAVQVS
jgi:hypothetical protein